MVDYSLSEEKWTSRISSINYGNIPTEIIPLIQFNINRGNTHIEQRKRYWNCILLLLRGIEDSRTCCGV